MELASPSSPPPWLIQGGMGIAISNWRLARAVARTGQLGVVSGTAIDTVFVRRLQDQGVDDELRSVLDQFPRPDVVSYVLRRFASVGRLAGTPYRSVAMLNHLSPARDLDVTLLASFVEVALAKRGHDGPVGINLLTKIQLPTAAALYGAMLAGVDYVLMGAGVPTHIPGVLDDLSVGRPVAMPLSVTGAPSDHPASSVTFDPTPFAPAEGLGRPKFVGIVSSHVLATALVRRSGARVDGLVVERPSAGGHNAPPRGRFEVDERGAPVYGARDHVDYDVLRELGVPFWIAGGVCTRADVAEAWALGATGVQVGTLFAYCEESGMDRCVRQRILREVSGGGVSVTTSLSASSTGYPFKVVDAPETVAAPEVFASRPRRCDLGYLREAYLDAHGSVGYRCAAEPARIYARKGGDPLEGESTTCLCNGLMATCGLGQVRANGFVEPPLVTSGDRVNDVAALLVQRDHYRALDVIDWLTPTVPRERRAQTPASLQPDHDAATSGSPTH